MCEYSAMSICTLNMLGRNTDELEKVATANVLGKYNRGIYLITQLIPLAHLVEI